MLVRGPDFALLYDAASNDDIARGDDNRTIAYLKTLQPPLQKIDHVVLSHPHRDHVELLPDVVTLFKPSEVWNSGAFNDICGYRNFLFAIAADPSVQYHTATQDAGTESVEMATKSCYGDKQLAQTLTLTHAKRITNEKIALGQGASMTFLFADGSPRSSFNENSLVVRLDLGSRRVLFMEDAEAGGRKLPSTLPSDSSIEGKLLTCCVPDLKADVLVVGHHGSKNVITEKVSGRCRRKDLHRFGGTNQILDRRLAGCGDNCRTGTARPSFSTSGCNFWRLALSGAVVAVAFEALVIVGLKSGAPYKEPCSEAGTERQRPLNE